MQFSRLQLSVYRITTLNFSSSLLRDGVPSDFSSLLNRQKVEFCLEGRGPRDRLHISDDGLLASLVELAAVRTKIAASSAIPSTTSQGRDLNEISIKRLKVERAEVMNTVLRVSKILRSRTDRATHQHFELEFLKILCRFLT